MKKIIALAGAGAILLSVAVPAFAVWPPFPMFGSKDVAIIKNNDVTAVANTGWNDQSNVADVSMGGGVSVSGSGDRYINTGNAYAKAKGVIVANTHVGCGPCSGGGFGDEDVAVVKRNDVGAFADTGYNAQGNYALVHMGGGVDVGGGGSRTVYTGAAYAKAKGYVVVNTHLSFGP